MSCSPCYASPEPSAWHGIAALLKKEKKSLLFKKKTKKLGRSDGYGHIFLGEIGSVF